MSVGHPSLEREPAQQASIRIESLHSLDHFQSCVDLQVAVWGYADGDLIPRRMFLLADRIGGQVLGAFDGEKIVGFAMALPGFRAGQPYLHSHMLAVLPEYRDLGLGRRLKLAQRDDAIARGFELMEWTFDPLEIKNAYFNIERLGAIVRRFTRNQYGTTSSHLHGGLPTDRCTAEWWMGSERVNAVLEGKLVDRGPLEASIEVPNDVAEIRANQPEHARAIQAGIAEQFEKYFDLGLAVTGFEKTATTGNYLIGRWNKP
jgi:predicted GNAT superfamily acetyltransferase